MSAESDLMSKQWGLMTVASAEWGLMFEELCLMLKVLDLMCADSDSTGLELNVVVLVLCRFWIEHVVCLPTVICKEMLSWSNIPE